MLKCSFLIIVLSWGLPALGQDDCIPGGCWTITDETCYDEDNCEDMDGAPNGIIFTPSCTGTFYFSCKLSDCENPGGCYNCIACAKLVNSSTGETWRSNCVLDAGGGCEGTCGPNWQQVSLQAGVYYSLTVTLKRCRDQEFCGLCDCTAKARVYGAESDCTVW